MSNAILLTPSTEEKLSKINIQQNKLLLKFKANSALINGLDIVQQLVDLVINRQNYGMLMDNYQQIKVILINNQSISLDLLQKKQQYGIQIIKQILELHKILHNLNSNIQLVWHQQFIITQGKKNVDFYSIDGEFVTKQKYQEFANQTIAKQLMVKVTLGISCWFLKSNLIEKMEMSIDLYKYYKIQNKIGCIIKSQKVKLMKGKYFIQSALQVKLGRHVYDYSLYQFIQHEQIFLQSIILKMKCQFYKYMKVIKRQMMKMKI
ncbi:hypothetical protein pb186bvf_019011 [Paramecium bursaria]